MATPRSKSEEEDHISLREELSLNTIYHAEDHSPLLNGRICSELSTEDKNDYHFTMNENTKTSEQWKHFMSIQRTEMDNQTAPSTITDHYRRPFQRDYDKVLFSSAFSRLKDKTQVFPLASHDSVHNRMNHSLEVHAVGKTLARAIFENSDVRKMVFQSEEAHMRYCNFLVMRDVEDIIATACLLHDIGNPPFGHSGEEAMRKWWRNWSPPAQWAVSEHWKQLKNNVIFKDFENFEGNATGFRLIQKKIPKLTFATMTTYVKYPRVAAVVSDRYKKNGIYLADLFKYKQIAEECNLTFNEDTKNVFEFSWMRHPLTYLVEAADDICYCVIDIEDGCRMKVITYEQAREQLQTLCPNTDPSSYAKLPIEEQVKKLRVDAIEHLVKKSVEKYCSQFDKYCSGECHDSLVTGKELKQIKQFSIENVYRHRSVIEIESAGFTIIKYLMDTFVSASMLSRIDKESSINFLLLPKQVQHDISKLLEGFEPSICEEPVESEFNIYEDVVRVYMGKSPLHGRENLSDPIQFCLLQQKLPPQQAENLYIIYHIVMTIADYISGMTDSFAKDLYQKLVGTTL